MESLRAYWWRCVFFVFILCCVAIYLNQPILSALSYNVFLNSFILILLLYGIISVFRQLQVLKNDALWFDSYCNQDEDSFEVAPSPKILTPLHILASQHKNIIETFNNHLFAQTFFSSIDSRLSALRKNNRYLASIVIFFGLLGTFWGLSKTIGSIITMLGSLETVDGDVGAFFTTIKRGIQEPLGGMGVAFSSSLFGLSASLIIGFLDQQVAQASSKFYNALEEKITYSMAGLIQLASKNISNDSLNQQVQESSDPLIINMNEPSEITLNNSDKNIIHAAAISNGNLGENNDIAGSLNIVAQRLKVLTEQIVVNQKFVKKIGDTQNYVSKALEELKHTNQSTQNLHSILEYHLKNLDESANKIVNELGKEKQAAPEQMQKEIRTLAKILALIIKKNDNQAA